MNFTKSLFVIVFVVVLFQSCAYHYGTIASSPASQPLRYEDVAIGVSQTVHILGMGGTNKDALILEAKKNLQINRSLRNSEMYANYTVNFKRNYYPFATRLKVTMSADVVTSLEDSTSPRYSQKYLNYLSSINLKEDFFALGDTVSKKRGQKGVITGVHNKRKVKVQYIDQRKHLRTKNVSIYKLYKKEGRNDSLIIGETVVTTKDLNYGKVQGLGINKVLFQDRDRTKFGAKYKNVIIKK